MKSELGVVVGCLENWQLKQWIPSRKVAVLSWNFTVHEDRFPGEDELVELSDYAPPLVVEREAMEKKRSVSTEDLGSTWSVPAPMDPAETFNEETEQEEISQCSAISIMKRGVKGSEKRKIIWMLWSGLEDTRVRRCTRLF